MTSYSSAGRGLRNRRTIQIDLVEPHSQFIVVAVDELSVSRPVNRNVLSVVKAIVDASVQHDIVGCEWVNSMDMMLSGNSISMLTFLWLLFFQALQPRELTLFSQVRSTTPSEVSLARHTQ